MFEGPEKKFQRHIADFLIKEHSYTVLEQEDISDSEYYFVEDHFISFVRATQKKNFKTLEENYGSDAPDEIIKALKKELRSTPLWLIIRNGITVRGLMFKLYYPKPRSKESVANKYYGENRLCFKDELVIGKKKRLDFVLFLNGLPVITMELKHEKNQNVHDAVDQYAGRDHKDKIFQLPFLHIAADTSDVMAATDPSDERNFRWHNTGLKNESITKGEYAVEFLYRNVLSKESILEALAFYLIYVPHRDAEGDKPKQPAFTIYPRFHQSRMVDKLSSEVLDHFSENSNLGKKYLIEHSAGSGKTLSICWLADRLHSLYKPDTNEKVVNIIFVLTDRKSLDKNIREDIEKFAHLSDVVGIAKRSKDLKEFIDNRKAQIVVSTQQKFKYILDEIAGNNELKKLRVAFLIDEAHRSQEGKTAVAVKQPFRDPDAQDVEDDTTDPQEEIAEIIKAHDNNQLFVAFTATPSPASIQLFGEPADTYSEDEAIQEGYILDVATGIISYKTLYNLHCPVALKPDDERLYPAGVVSKALKNIAYQDDGLIQYKAEVMLRIFEEKIIDLIDGRAKAMIVATSRIAGLRYFNIFKEKLKERGSRYKVLYAFSPFVNPDTNEAITENGVNDLSPGEHIEDRFEGDDYKLLVVANKFQEGFDQPLLAGMFLDKAVVDRNAVQTLSRLNRCYHGKDKIVVVDFTNNATAILKAFKKYRKGTPFEPTEPDQNKCVDLYNQILSKNVFTQADAENIAGLIAENNDAPLQFTVNALRIHFQESIIDREQRKEFAYLMEKFVKTYYFLISFFQYPDEIAVFVAFAEYVGPQLIKKGSVSDLMKQIRKTTVIKANVKYKGEVAMPGTVKVRTGGGSGVTPPVNRISVQDAIEKIRKEFTITDDEAIIIREVTEEKMQDKDILNTISLNRDDVYFLRDSYKNEIDGLIQKAYEQKDKYEALFDPKYTDEGAIFDIMAFTVIEHGLQVANTI